jgi:serine/alanine adding enzyme
MSVDIVRELPEEEWCRFVEDCPGGNIFHTPEMFSVFGRGKRHHPELWAAVQKGKVRALLLPVRVIVMEGVMEPFTTRSIVYGGPLYEPSDEGREALKVLLGAYKNLGGNGTLFTEMRNLTLTEDVQEVLSAEGFNYEEHLNYLIDLKRSPEEILQSMGQRTRKNIRRALRQNKVLIEDVNSRDQIEPCYELLSSTYRRARVPLADRSLFESAFDLLGPKRMIRFTLARVDGAAAAVSVELLYKDVMFGWYGGMNREYGAYLPNELLNYHILVWGATNGFSVYDFGGAGTPSEEYGVRDFKAKFGGQLVSLGRNVCVHAPIKLKISKGGYALYRRLIG